MCYKKASDLRPNEELRKKRLYRRISSRLTFFEGTALETVSWRTCTREIVVKMRNIQIMISNAENRKVKTLLTVEGRRLLRLSVARRRSIATSISIGGTNERTNERVDQRTSG